MYKLTIPLSELVARLINLNEDRRVHYEVFHRDCISAIVSAKFAELTSQSISNLEELSELELAPGIYTDLCGSYKVPSVLWGELKSVLNHKDLFIVIGRTKIIEDQVEIMYNLVFRMLIRQDAGIANLIQRQFETQVRSKAELPGLFLYYN